MFVRIVKMSFHKENIPAFLEMFDEKKAAIKNREGCEFLELYQDKTNPEIFFTYSHWKHVDNLEAYRNSELFKNVWKQTKAMFNDKPYAWSVDKLVSLS
ncbi:antibiotic biosynthesis monooxygenase family protein [uncultured Kordia sp.]|uniref:putative quinol monooxygenase n=1 Tax=uncultured Kordia sp. TaxID=507699 RepID=UPI00260CDA80|nr:antibiotic biosynthesis monooxygenase family protein [uncultured Kordia sp.]